MRLLLIEDSERLAQYVTEGLKRAGFELDHVMTCEEAEAAMRAQPYDALILDLGLPDKDGMDFLREVRQSDAHTPVLIVTARDGLPDRVAGLNTGADDYLVKPFAMEELAARVRALLRRPGQSLGLTLRAGALTFDTQTRQLTVADEPVALTRRESDLLEQLLRSANRVLSKESIESRLYSYGSEGSANSVEVLLHRLRRKIETDRSGIRIFTLRGIGYMLRENENSAAE